MPKADDKQMAVAQVYSRAMHDLAQSRNEAGQLDQELQEVAVVVERYADFAAFASSPLVDGADRAKTLEKLFRGRASDLLVDSLQVINRKGRLGLLPAIAEAYHLGHQQHLGKVDVRVSTAVALGDGLRRKLMAALETHSARQPHLIEEVDESLIGGIVLRIEDEKIDASVIHQIDRLRRRLRERSEHEIHRSRRAAADAAR